MSLLKILKENLSVNEISDIINTFKDNDIILSKINSDLDIYDNGSYAKVYEIKNSNLMLRIGLPRLLTYEHDSKVLDSYNKLSSQNFTNVVKIYLYKYINKYEYVIMEKLNPLSSEDLDIIELLIYYLFFFQSNVKYLDFNNDDNLKKTLTKFFTITYGDIKDFDEILNTFIETIIDNKKEFSELCNGYLELQSIGITHTDIHEGNIMKDDKGTLKLIDWF